MQEIIIFFIRLCGVAVINLIGFYLARFVDSGIYLFLIFGGSIAYLFGPYLSNVNGFYLMRGGCIKETPEIIWKIFAIFCFILAAILYLSNLFKK